jgi:MoxR-like ATPase
LQSSKNNKYNNIYQFGKGEYMEKVTIEGVEIYLTEPDNIPIKWVGQEDLVTQILAAWLVVEKDDIPLNPRLIGKPGVGKTTLAYYAAKKLGKPAYMFQATVDTRPEDLIITPVISEEGKIRYIASPIVSAMIKGGIAIIDEGNRMSEKSWASLAPLLDNRRYVESIIAGVKIYAHPDFRICVTMNEDASTFELPEYISSRLQPQIYIDFPDREEELMILKSNLPFADDEILEYVVNFLQVAHASDERYTVRDGINIARYALKRIMLDGKDADKTKKLKFLREAAVMILDKEAARYFSEVILDEEKD